MKIVSKNRKASKQQKQARKIQQEQRQIAKRKKNLAKWRKLTSIQKEERCKKLAERKIFKANRKKLNKEKNETERIKKIDSTLFSIFNLDILNKLAKETGFIKRTGGEITAFAFMYIVSFGFLGNGAIALNYLVAGLSEHFNIIVTPQALSKRINNPYATKFLKSVFQKLLGIQIKLGLKNQFSEKFSMFTGIYLQDSSQIEVNEELSEHFKGPGGGASSSGIKLDFIYDIANCLIHAIKLSGATVNDQTNSKEILKCLKLGSLVIRDLGYFTIDSLRKIAECGFYLTRLSISTNIYLNQNDDKPLDVPKYLEKLKSEGKSSSNIKVYIGKLERFETRLVAEKVPQTVLTQRLQRFKKERKKTPSEYYTEWCGYSIFITNIVEEMFSGKMILELYKIRWQIELVFKNFKSNIQINILKGTNKHRITSLIYGKLITIVLIYILQNFVTNIAKDKEISGDKLTKLLISDNRLRHAIIQNSLSLLLIKLEQDIILVCKQNHKRKTTLYCLKELLEDEITKELPDCDVEPFFLNNVLMVSI